MAKDDWKVRPLAGDFVELYRSPDPAHVHCGCAGLASCPGGRLIATYSVRTRDAKKLAEPKFLNGTSYTQGRLCTSDDHGKTWTFRVAYPFTFATTFLSGETLWLLGAGPDLMIMRSADWGETWSAPTRLTEGQKWHQNVAHVIHANGAVYLVMERDTGGAAEGWPVSDLAPVLMRAREGDDLTRRDCWTFASELVFHEAVSDRELDWFGVPFYPVFYPTASNVGGGRSCSPIGWLETNLVRFVDPNHVWHDPKGRTFHLWMRAHTGGTGFAAIAKVVENDDDSMTTMLETVPSGKKAVYVPCPGGQMRFSIVYDGPTGLYWLLSTQATDSMTRPERLPRDRYSLPNNERRRLQLHFSRNCIDWCFAGLVAVGPVEKASRHYASMVVDGDDLHILSRSGDEQAKNAHDGDIITFHTVRYFRDLAY